MKRYFFTLLLLVLVSVPPLAAASTVTIPDPKLRAAVKKALGAKADAEITAAKMADLTNLKAAKSKVSDLTGLEYAINLAVLKIANNRITDISPLGGLTALKELGLYNNRIKDLSPLASLTNLQKLNIRSNRVTDISPLRGLTGLKELRVGNNRIADVQPLTGLTGLKQLYIAGNPLTNAYLLSSLTGLTHIDITIPDPPDTTEPEATITVETVHERTASRSVNVNGPFKIIIEFTEPVSNFERSDILLAKGRATISNFRASGATTYTATVTPPLDTDKENRYIRFVIPPGAATDAAGNPNLEAAYGNVYIDMEPLNVYITAPTSEVTAETFTVSIKFTDGSFYSYAEEPFGFDQSDLSLVNNTAGARVTGWSLGTDYITTATISVARSGRVTLQVREGVATDVANNGNTAASPQTVTVRRPGSDPPASTDLDTTEPDVTLTVQTAHVTTASGSASVNGPFKIIIEFTEPVSNFERSDILLARGRAVISNFRVGEANTYTATVTPEIDEDNRYIRLEIPPGAATDAAGNPNRGFEYGNVYIDMERPNVYITAPTSEVTAETFTVSIKFADEPNWRAQEPFGFAQSDLSLVNNTAGARVTGWSLGTDYITTATISVARSGRVTLRVAEGIATDRANNNNTASLQKTVTVRRPGSDLPASTDLDTTEPEVTISVQTAHVTTASDSVDVNGPFKVIITFTEPVSNFERSDILLEKGRATISNFRASGATTYTATVTPDLNEGNRYIRFVIPPGAATDAAGNPNLEAEYGNAWIDMERPNVYITAPSEVTTETFTVSIKFGERPEWRAEEAFGFDQSDLSFVNNTAGATVTDWSLGGDYITTATIAVARSGSVTLRVDEGVATDSANNSNTASLQKTVAVRHPHAAPAANGSVPNQTSLHPNYPNPFNPETWIPYHLANDSDVQISIYDLNGGLVRQLDLGYQHAGYYTNRSRAAYWDGRNEFGERVATGIYFYHLAAGDYSQARKMIILK